MHGVTVRVLVQSNVADKIVDVVIVLLAAAYAVEALCVWFCSPRRLANSLATLLDAGAAAVLCMDALVYDHALACSARVMQLIPLPQPVS